MTLADLKFVLRSEIGRVQDAVLFNLVDHKTIRDGGTIESIVTEFPDAEVRNLAAVGDKLIICAKVYN